MPIPGDDTVINYDFAGMDTLSGDLRANFNVAYQEVSDFGGLPTVGGGVNWSRSGIVGLAELVTVGVGVGPSS